MNSSGYVFDFNNQVNYYRFMSSSETNIASYTIDIFMSLLLPVLDYTSPG